MSILLFFMELMQIYSTRYALMLILDSVIQKSQTTYLITIWEIMYACMLIDDNKRDDIHV